MSPIAPPACLVSIERFEVLDPQQVEELEGIASPEGPTLLKELADLLRAEMPTRLQGLAEDIARRQNATIAAKAHALAGSAASLGARQLQQALRELENAAKTGDWAQISVLFQAIGTVWQRLEAALAVRVRQ